MRANRQLIEAASASCMCALLIERSITLRWWHPECSSGDAAPYATGFPLPYSQWTMASSLEYFVSVPALIADILILSVPLFFLFKWIGGLNATATPRMIAIALLGLLSVFVAHQLYITSHPVVTLAGHGEKFIQYRPRFFEPAKANATCEIYD